LLQSRREAADVALVDYHLAGEENGLLLALDLKQQEPPPGVVIYSGYAEEDLAAGAHLVGANALLGKGAPVDDLFDAVRAAARGECRLPAITPESAERARSRLSEADGALFEDLVLRGEPVARSARDSLRRMVGASAPGTVAGENPAPTRLA
jgi:DNA-binding NarL/FixJ family response regulator